MRNQIIEHIGKVLDIIFVSKALFRSQILNPYLKEYHTLWQDSA